ncbi:MAG: NAD(P)/FAD-dependent oxidoreductase [Patescibacteria group bacterium]
MKIAIIGAGYTGLAAGYFLSKSGHSVTLFERDSEAGGLAAGFRPDHRRGKGKNWEWKLEKAYHHLFENDSDILSLCQDLGISDTLILKRPLTAIFHTNKISQFDSPLTLLTFPGLSLVSKIRTAFLLAFLKVNPFWKPLEKITAQSLFQTVGGEEGWRVLWEPLMRGKFGPHIDTVPASWLWARITKRTSRLYYFRGGFTTFVAALVKAIKKLNSSILLNTEVTSISQINNGFRVTYGKKSQIFDKVILTVPSPVINKIVPTFPRIFTDKLLSIDHLSAQTLILETKEPILQGESLQSRKDSPCVKNIYWLSINDRSFPFLAVVAHTNFMDKKYYGGNHITYIGNYLPAGHPYLTMTKGQLLRLFLPYIQRLNPSFQLLASVALRRSGSAARLAKASAKRVICHLFTAPFAQPVHTLNYSQKAPQFVTPIPGVYIANLDSIVPWDRGTNYAVKLGRDVAKIIGK